jgi:hypothetical protein
MNLPPPALGASYASARPTQNAGRLLYGKFCR